MKVVIFTDTYFPQINGVTYSISLIKKRLRSRGHVVKVVFPSSENYDSGENEISIRSLSLPFYDGYRIGLPETISDKIDNPDVIHTHTPFSVGGLGAYIAKRGGSKRVSTVHTCPGDYVEYITKINTFKKILQRLYVSWEIRFLKGADIVTVPSQIIKDEMEKKEIDNIKILKNGVDTNFFEPKKRTLIEKNGPVIGYSGRHSKEKKVGDIIKVAERFEDFHVLISGDGPYREKYEQMAKNLENVNFLGFLDREKLPSFYSTLDVFVFPSVSETQGLVALEANSCGTPVVAAHSRALKETVKEGVNGFLYTPGDIDELEKKIKFCIDKKEELRESCIKYAEEHSAEKFIENLLDIYRSV